MSETTVSQQISQPIHEQECPICYEKFKNVVPSLTPEQISCMYIAAQDYTNWESISGSSQKVLIIDPSKLYSKDSVMFGIPPTSIKFSNVSQIQQTFGNTVLNALSNSKTIHANSQDIFKLGVCNHGVCENCEQRLRENKCPICRKENFLQPFFKPAPVFNSSYETSYETNIGGTNINNTIINTSYIFTNYTFSQLLDTSGISSDIINSATSSPINDTYSFQYDEIDYNSEDEREAINERREREYAGDYGESYNNDENDSEYSESDNENYGNENYGNENTFES